MTEKQIENQILEWLNYQQDCFAFKINTVGVWDQEKKIYRRNLNRYLLKGTADIIGLIKGKFFALEIKTPASLKRWIRNPTDGDLKQRLFLKKVAASGGIAGCVDNLDEVIQRFKTLSNMP